MKISEKMLELFERQIAHEASNANLYFKIASVLRNIGLESLAKFFDEQAEGEYSHKKILINYLCARNVNFAMLEIPEMDYEFSGFINLGVTYHSREVLTTEMIKEMTHLALMEGDDLTYQHLMETLIKEQIEEEDLSRTFLDNAMLSKDEICTFSILFEQNIK